MAPAALAAALPIIGGPLGSLAARAASDPRNFAKTVLQFAFTGTVAAWAIFGLNGRRIAAMEGDRTFDAGAFEFEGAAGGDSGSSGGPLSSDGNFPGNDAGQEKIGAWLGVVMQKAGLPKPLATMTALAESGMRTGPAVRYQDLDSAGPYQVRVNLHGWSLSQAESWEYSTANWFVKNALRYKGQFPNTAAGLGAWCQAVQGSAYPGRYQEQYNRAVELSGK